MTVLREALADILALAEHADKYRPRHFADKVIAKCTNALSASVPPADGANRELLLELRSVVAHVQWDREATLAKIDAALYSSSETKS